MAKHTTRPRRSTSPERRRFPRNAGVAAALVASGLGGVSLAEAFNAGTAVKAVAAEQRITPADTPSIIPKAHEQEVKVPKIPEACPAPPAEFIKRYSGGPVNPVSIPEFNTSNAIQKIKKTTDKQTILATANAALKGKVTLRPATKQDQQDAASRPDQPTPAAIAAVSAVQLRETTSGILESLDGMPESLGELTNEPIDVILTPRIITPENDETVTGEFTGTNDFMLEYGTDSRERAGHFTHELGHYLDKVGTSKLGATDCFDDPAIQRPRNLTLYALDHEGTKEVVADTFAIGQGAVFSDIESQNVYTDPINKHNDAVMFGRLAAAGLQLEADQLYNRSLYAK